MAISVTMAWLNLLTYLRQMPWFGVYVLMFWEILKTFTQFAVVFIIFIISFALGFHILFINQVPFERVRYSLLKTSVMMIGELEYGDIFEGGDSNQMFPILSWMFFACFLIAMPIIIMNLLVGLAVDDIQVKKMLRGNFDLRFNYSFLSRLYKKMQQRRK